MMQSKDVYSTDLPLKTGIIQHVTIAPRLWSSSFFSMLACDRRKIYTRYILKLIGGYGIIWDDDEERDIMLEQMKIGGACGSER
jgi:hypothetical protein